MWPLFKNMLVQKEQKIYDNSTIFMNTVIKFISGIRKQSIYQCQKQ